MLALLANTQHFILNPGFHFRIQFPRFHSGGVDRFADTDSDRAGVFGLHRVRGET